jgi:hypothetical protein
MENYPVWVRIHPVAEDETLAVAVQARLYDPLWLLGRQWQLNEFRHDAGASPVDVLVEGTKAPLSRLRGGVSAAPDGAVALLPRDVPVETVVEREPIAADGLAELRLRAEAGLQLQRRLRAGGLNAEADAWVGRAPFSLPPGVILDEETAAFWDLIEGRVPDGAKLAAAVRAVLDGHAPAVSDAERVVLADWQRWNDTRVDAPAAGPPSWNPEHLEYVFSAAALRVGGEAVLSVPEAVEGGLDWFAFDGGRGSLGLGGQPEERVSLHRIPSPLDFAGKPNPRFWTLEDPAVRFDLLSPLAPGAQPSPATLMVLNFALEYGDDWFLVGVPLPAWSVFDATRVAITDCFGDVTLAERPGGRWNLFRLHDESVAASQLSPLFVCASPAQPLEGPPVEEVHFLRDEVTNVAWAVEQVVPHPLGHGSERREPAADTPLPTASGLTWTLAPPSPPQSWFPLLPKELGRLTLGRLWSARNAVPRGRVLSEVLAASGRVAQEEVPPEGVQVTRTWQSARASGGSLHLWVGRKKSPRRTDLAPALRFDVVEWRKE